MKKGFIYLHKVIKTHPIYKNAEHLKMFIGFILDAAWGDYTVNVDGKFYKLQKGQLITSRKELSEELELAPRTITKYLMLLEDKYDVIRKLSIGKKYIITVKNYEKYQRK